MYRKDKELTVITMSPEERDTLAEELVMHLEHITVGEYPKMEALCKLLGKDPATIEEVPIG